MDRRMLGALIALPLFALLVVELRSPPTAVSETERIQDHLSRVSSALRSRPPAHLTDQQLEARRTTLEWLDEYRAAGVFPHNHVRSDARVPVFVDPHGTPCAVGYLLLRSGQHDLVEKIVRTDNLVRVRELEGDAGVAAWLDARGLTLEEAALIQPMYGPPIGSPVPVSSSYASTTVGLSIVTAALASYAAMAEPTGGAPWVDALVLGTGIAHTYMILGRTDGVEEPAWAAGLNILGVVASIGSAVLRVAGRRDSGAKRSASSEIRPYVKPGRNGTELGFAVSR